MIFRKPATAIIAILAIVFLEAVGTGLIIPLFPRLLQDLAGKGPSESAPVYGLMLSSSLLMVFLFSQLLGRLSDRYGRRPLLLATLAGTIATYLLLATAHSVWMLLAAQLVGGFCAASGAVGRAYIAEVTSPDARARSYGLIAAAGGLGFIVGPAIGGYLGRLGLQTPFYVAAAVSSATLAFAFLGLPESQDPADRRAFSWRATMPLAALPTLWRTPPLVRGVIVASLVEAFAVGVPSEIGALVLFMQQALRWDAAQVGLWLTVMGLATAIGQAAFTPFAIRLFGERGSWLVGMSGTVLVLASAVFIQEGWQMYALVAAFALLSFVTPVALSIVSKEVAANRLGELQGAYMSVASVVKALAILAGTTAYGFFTGPLSPVHLAGIAFLIGAAVQVAAVAIAATTLRTTRRAAEGRVVARAQDQASLV